MCTPLLTGCHARVLQIFFTQVILPVPEFQGQSRLDAKFSGFAVGVARFCWSLKLGIMPCMHRSYTLMEVFHPWGHKAVNLSCENERFSSDREENYEVACQLVDTSVIYGPTAVRFSFGNGLSTSKTPSQIAKPFGSAFGLALVKC